MTLPPDHRTAVTVVAILSVTAILVALICFGAIAYINVFGK